MSDSGALKQAIDNDDAQSTLAILNQNRDLLNQYCVSIYFRFLLPSVLLFNWPMLPICHTNYQLVCIWQKEFYNIKE